MLHALNIIHNVHLLLPDFIVPKQALHGAHSKEALFLQGGTCTLHLLYARAERAEDAVWPETCCC